jgi:Zn-dependent M28 family amino/carboxypeptidase
MRTPLRSLLPLLCSVTLIYAATPSIDPTVYLNEIKFLASPELRGRATGSPELEKAAAFIVGKFREFGLKPADGKDYYQAFQVTTSAKPGPGNRLTIKEPGGSDTLQFEKDFTAFNFSHAGHLAGAIVFAGYGITAPEYHYDDYANIDVKGKIVLILRHEPQEPDEHSVFAGKAFTQHAQFASKASNAKMHGAAGVILVNDVFNHRGDGDKLQTFGTAEGPEDAGIPFLQVKESTAERWFAALGKHLDQVMQGIDKDLKSESFAFPASFQVDGAVDLERLVKTVHNVDAYLPGTTNEYVIIGAHYDHLGLGGQFSLAPKMTGTVHPGADDNASGTAGVIELARYFSKQPKQKRGILFVTFAGEELGLLGSAFWAAHPELPLDNAVAMINMDMIGRAKNGKIYVGGSSSGSTLRAMLEQTVPKHADIKVDYSEGPESGSSDHTSFTAKKVPALFFFSGLHSDYHKPSDTWDKIDAPDAVKVLQLVADVTEQLREQPGRPEFVKAAAPAAHGATGDAGPVSGYGPWFGSVPDFGEGIQGVKFADVTAGSPAAKAGLQANDVMVEFDGKPIQNLYDFTYALRGKKPGDEVAVKVMRDGKPLNVNVLLARRP